MDLHYYVAQVVNNVDWPFASIALNTLSVGIMLFLLSCNNHLQKEFGKLAEKVERLEDCINRRRKKKP